MAGVMHSQCFTACLAPPPCVLNWFPPPCVCTVAAPAGAEAEGQAHAAQASRAAVSKTAKS